MPDKGINRRAFLQVIGLTALLSACGERPGAGPTTTEPAAGSSVVPGTSTPRVATKTQTTTGSTAASTNATTPQTGPATTETGSTTKTGAVPTTAPTTTASPTTTTTTISTPPTGPATLQIEPRAAWGARDAIVDLLEEHSGSMRLLTVHHSGDGGGLTGPERFRRWQEWHMDGRGWGDLAYHYIIGLDGIVYQARSTDYRGDTGTSYETDRHFLVVLEGNYEEIQPTAGQLDRLPVVLAWAAGRFGMSADTIAGHRDYAATKCPGKNLYPIVSDGTLQDQVEEIIASGGVTLV